MSDTTREVIDTSKRGKRGFPRFPEAFGRAPPIKIVPVDEVGRPDISHPGMTLQQYAAARRWEKEVGGLEFNGLIVATDDRSKMLISGARQGADNDPAFTTRFKFADGQFSEINASTIVAISDAVLLHVRHCFSLEENVLADIEAGEISSFEQVDEAFA